MFCQVCESDLILTSNIHKNRTTLLPKDLLIFITPKAGKLSPVKLSNESHSLCAIWHPTRAEVLNLFRSYIPLAYCHFILGIITYFLSHH